MSQAFKDTQLDFAMDSSILLGLCGNQIEEATAIEIVDALAKTQFPKLICSMTFILLTIALSDANEEVDSLLFVAQSSSFSFRFQTRD